VKEVVQRCPGLCVALFGDFVPGLQAVQQALGQYREEVEGGAFPSEAFSPYKISDGHRTAAAEAARADGFLAAAAALDPGECTQTTGASGSP
jgi:hypothetical protein